MNGLILNNDYVLCLVIVIKFKNVFYFIYLCFEIPLTFYNVQFRISSIISDMDPNNNKII